MSRDNEPDSPDWDDWVRTTTLGQFQQLAGWSKFKCDQGGWNRLLVMNVPGDVRSGGAHLLWKASRGVRLGYIPKGPVLPHATADGLMRFMAPLRQAARELRLKAVLVQPPDGLDLPVATWSKAGFETRPVAFVAGATAIASLDGGVAGIDQRLRKRFSRAVKQGRNRGTTIRWGTRADLAAFFPLMKFTCERQHTRPNPGSVPELEAMWDRLPEAIHLVFADVEGLPNAGLLMISLGDRLTFWKKGWNGEHPRHHANTVLMVEAMNWAAESGFKNVDFAGMDLDLAQKVLDGDDLESSTEHPRDLFNLRLGAQPYILPGARIYVCAPPWRWIVRLFRRIPGWENALMRRVGGF